MKFIESQAIGIPAAATILVFVGGACIWLEHRFTRIEDRFDRLPCEHNGCAQRAKRKRKR